MLTHWRSPLDSVCGKRLANPGFRPNRSCAARTRALRSLDLPMRWMSSPAHTDRSAAGAFSQNAPHFRLGAAPVAEPAITDSAHGLKNAEATVELSAQRVPGRDHDRSGARLHRHAKVSGERISFGSRHRQGAAHLHATNQALEIFLPKLVAVREMIAITVCNPIRRVLWCSGCSSCSDLKARSQDDLKGPFRVSRWQRQPGESQDSLNPLQHCSPTVIWPAHNGSGIGQFGSARSLGGISKSISARTSQESAFR